MGGLGKTLSGGRHPRLWHLVASDVATLFLEFGEWEWILVYFRNKSAGNRFAIVRFVG